MHSSQFGLLMFVIVAILTTDHLSFGKELLVEIEHDEVNNRNLRKGGERILRKGRGRNGNGNGRNRQQGRNYGGNQAGQGRGGGGGANGNGNGHRGRNNGGGGFFGRSNSMTTIQNLIDHRNEIEHSIDYDYHGPDGVGLRTTITSSNSQVSSWIQERVKQMIDCIENNQEPRSWDPLFAKTFERKDELNITATNIDDGVVADLLGLTDCGKSLAKAHADLVTKFIENGRSELQKEHPAPLGC